MKNDDRGRQMQVDVNFLGEPRLWVEQKEKTLGKNKLEALLFYLLFQEEVDRDEVASVFWPMHDSNKGKSSLRNSLYEIRQILGFDLFSASTRDKILLDRNILLFKDVDELVEAHAKGEYRDYPSHIFMQNKDLKNNPVYESWLLSIRNAYQNILLNNLRAQLLRVQQSGRGPEIVAIARQILETEPYDEDTLRILMQYYADNQQYNDAMAVFKRMKDLLKDELMVEPEPETLKLADFIQFRKVQTEVNPVTGFQSSRLLMNLTQEYQSFLNGSSLRHVVIFGEPGSGRTDLIQSFLGPLNLKTVSIRLDSPNQKIPEGFLLKWAREFQGKGQEDFRKLLLHLPEKPLICVIENLEYIDNKSLIYLTDFLSSSQNRIFFILEATREFLRRNDSIALLVQNDNLSQIEVPLLSRAELHHYLQSCVEKDNRVWSEDRFEEVYEHSQGNLLLAREYLNPTGQAERLFLRLTAGLSEEEKSLLEACSIYTTGFTPQMLRIHTQEPGSLMKILRSLLMRGLLSEENELLRIKYPPLQKWLYDQLPGFYRTHLHELAAGNTAGLNLSRRQESQYQAMHWKMARHTGKFLYHHLREVEQTLNLFDQMYPTDIEPDDLPEHFHQNSRQYDDQLKTLVQQVNEYCESSSGPDAVKMELISNYLMGRHLIAGGKREDGIKLIHEVIRRSKFANDPEYLLKGYIEVVHYGIQKDDMDLMGRYIKLAEELNERMEWGTDQRKRAEVLRLSGLYEYNIGNLEAGLEKLIQADDILKQSWYRKTGFLARAGTLNYIGHIRKTLGDLSGADAAYQESIGLVNGKLHKCLDILYADYGRFLWENNRIDEADGILEKALTEYQILGTHWKRPATEAILGLIAVSRKDSRKARTHLVNAQIFHRADHRKGEEELIRQLSQAVRVRQKN